jgi:hypothetical protein
MSYVEQLEKIVPSKSRTWGAYDAKGDRAVNTAMTFAANGLIDLARKEAEGETDVPFSLAKRAVIVEKAVIKFRKACEKHPDSGLEDTDVRDSVHGFLCNLLHKSGVDFRFAHDLVDSTPLDRF